MLARLSFSLRPSTPHGLLRDSSCPANVPYSTGPEGWSVPRAAAAAGCRYHWAGLCITINFVGLLVVVRKKSGTLHVCVDLCAVNKPVIPDRYPLPTSKELMAQFHSSTVYSKLDLREGYPQVPLHPESRDLMAFVTALLRHLLRRNEPLVWSPECTKAVQTLKAQLTLPPVLAHFDISSRTMVTCDASAMAIGAVLS